MTLPDLPFSTAEYGRRLEKTRAGIERGARRGYPIGVSCPPDRGERTISLREDDHSVPRKPFVKD